MTSHLAWSLNWPRYILASFLYIRCLTKACQYQHSERESRCCVVTIWRSWDTSILDIDCRPAARLAQAGLWAASRAARAGVWVFVVRESVLVLRAVGGCREWLFVGAFLYDLFIFMGGESPVNYPLERTQRAMKKSGVKWKRRLHLDGGRGVAL